MALAAGSAFVLAPPAAAPPGPQLPPVAVKSSAASVANAAGTRTTPAAAAPAVGVAAALFGGAVVAMGRGQRAARNSRGRFAGKRQAQGRIRLTAAVSDTVVPAHVDEQQVIKHEGGADADFVKFRQNFAEIPEQLLNAQVKMELDASHQYLAMAAYFDRADVALPGFREWAMEQSKEEREHALKFIEYVNLRGGTYVPMPTDKPERDTFSSALDAMKCALTMEMQVNKSLLHLHQAASDATDPQLCDFLESNYLEEQVESINKIAKVIRKLIRAGPGLGEYTVDKDMD